MVENADISAQNSPKSPHTKMKMSSFHLITQGGAHIQDTNPPNTNRTFAKSHVATPPPPIWYQYQLSWIKFWNIGIPPPEILSIPILRQLRRRQRYNPPVKKYMFRHTWQNVIIYVITYREMDVSTNCRGKRSTAQSRKNSFSLSETSFEKLESII